MRRTNLSGPSGLNRAAILFAALTGVATLVAVLSSGTVGAQEATPTPAPASGICDRTQQVRDTILAKLSDISNCADVTDSDLMGIAALLQHRMALERRSSR